MKILHLIGGELSEGANRGAFWLHQAQRRLGLDSTLVTSGRDSFDDHSVVALNTSTRDSIKFYFLNQLGNLPVSLYRKRERVIFNTGFTGINITRLPEYKKADLIHLHWINGLVAMRTLRKVEKPVVWTMRDMWPFTGGCHVAAAFGCERYQIGCGECPQLRSKRSNDLTRLVVANKQASLPKQLRMVGISRWLSDCASSSQVFGDFPVQTISNNIDTQSFSPVPQDIAREIIGLPKNKRLILVGAQNWSYFYKGFDLFFGAIQALRRTDIHVVTFGRQIRQSMSTLACTTTHLGVLNDMMSLRLAYSAADIFVAPSLMEAFGKTLAEAMACGTPVVCFDATGPKDIVEHQVTGYRATPFEPNDLARGMDWILDLPSNQYKVVRRNSRERAIKYFDSQVIAKQYRELYTEILESI